MESYRQWLIRGILGTALALSLTVASPTAAQDPDNEMIVSFLLEEVAGWEVGKWAEEVGPKPPEVGTPGPGHDAIQIVTPA